MLGAVETSSSQSITAVGMDIEAKTGAEAKLAKKKFFNLGFEPQFEFLSRDESAATRLTGAKRISTIQFSDVNYSLKGTGILHNITGRNRQGQVMTIIGPSKSGKTKFLNVLAGAVRSTSASKQEVTGSLLANDEDLYTVLRPGFVPKNESIFGVATVLEELQFSTSLRLPATVSADDKASIIADILASTGLQEDSHTKVKALSKGKRKLLALGIELASLPNAVFLDEPTTGLGPDEAWRVIAVLNGLAASRACAVVCSLAQPTSEVFALLNHIVLLAKGRCIYNGPADGLSEAFDAKGLTCPKEHNPCDFALMCARTLSLNDLPSPSDAEGNTGDKRLQLTKTGSVFQAVEGSEVKQFLARPRHRSFMVEFGHLLQRELRATRRDPRILLGRLVMTSIIMTICAVVFLYEGDWFSTTYFIGSHFASFVFTMFTSCFGVIVPNVLYISETKGVYVRERALNTYGTMPYVLARMLPELIINFFLAVVCVLFMYWSALWKGSFILIVVAFFLLLISCTSWAYLLAMAVPNDGAAVALVALVLVPQLLFMGTFVRISSLPIWLQWVSYICNITYALRIVAANEAAACTTSPFCPQWAGLNAQNIVSSANIWWYCLVLVGFWLVLRFFAFFAMRKRILSAKHFGGL